MLSILEVLGLVLLTVGQAAALFLVPIVAVVIIIKAVKVFFLCNLTIAELDDYEYETKEKLKRDYANDRDEYEYHFFSPDVQTHVKAYRWETEIKCNAKYRYIVNDYAYFLEDTNEVKSTSEMPPATMEVFYSKRKPHRSFSKASCLFWITMELVLLVFIWLANFVTQGISVISNWAYVIIAFIFISLFWLLISIKFRKANG